MEKILILIPAYNESEHITGVVDAAREFFPVLVIDDGSIDETVDKAQRAGAVVISQKPNQGKGAALRAGFRYALRQDFDAVITLDADGQHDPEEIPTFHTKYTASHPDLIIGARDFTKMPALRRFGNSLGRILFSWAIGQNILDNQSGYRLISKRLMEATLSSEEHGFEFEVEMVMLCIRLGFSLDWVPIQTIYAGQSSHIRPASHAKRFVKMILKIRSDSRC